MKRRKKGGSHLNRLLEEDIDGLIEKKNVYEAFIDKTIMVTGAGGLLGSIIVLGFLKYSLASNKRIHVVALVHNLEKAERIFGEYASCKFLEFIEHDVINEFCYTERQIDYIIHGASITASHMFVSNPVETIRTALFGTENILKFAKACKVRGIIYLSSLEVYGKIAGEGNKVSLVSEGDYGYIDILNVRSSYSESKRMVENMFMSYAKEYAVSAKIARLAQTFGPGISYTDKRVFAEFLRNAVEGNDIILHTKGETVRNYCYTVDAAAAILYILLYGEIGEAYNVSGDETTISIYDMAQMICKKSNKDIDIIVKNDIDASMGYNPVIKIELDNRKLKELGWRSSTNINLMIDRTLEYMQVEFETGEWRKHAVKDKTE